MLKNYVPGFGDADIVRKLCPRNPNTDNLQNMLNNDIKMCLEADSFLNSFKMSRANNLEIRMPFVNEELFEFAYSMPSDMKINKDTNEIYIEENIRDSSSQRNFSI